ncbi:putative oxidoreductase YteT [Dendropsophus ebraccatus]|uniref:putative oxidoreductase YteT n=1 Tax=Dendropsophus ebraccatus TaxID=150705 RepID=UPI003831D66D
MDFLSKVFRSSRRKNPGPSAQDSRTSDFDAHNTIDFDTPRPDVGEVKCVTVLVVGAGSRGMCYTYYAYNFPKRMKIVGVADPQLSARETLKMIHRIDEEKFFDDWREAAKLEKFADAVIIATPDRLHKDPAVTFAKKGYHILLEKPMAVTPEDCHEIVTTCKENGVLLAVGHVMRYHPVSRKIKELLDSGVIGDIVHIQHMEPVGFWHFAHSFVRGNWRNEKESTFSLLAKSCHDIDLISYWMGDQRCVKVSSFGNLSHFTKENKPEGASSRCLDCAVEETCPYSAQKVYLKKAERGGFGWPVSVVCGLQDIESLTDALRTGPYGRCVYECDNDVVSHQVVNMEFEGGQTAAFTMMAFTKAMGARTTTVYGTKGELRCFGRGPVEVFDFATSKDTKHLAKVVGFMPVQLSAHSGADYYLIDSFISAVADGDPSHILSGPDDTLRSHLLVFQAEKSRRESRVVDTDE